MSTAIRQSAEYVPSGDEYLRETARTFRTLFETMASAIFIYQGKSLRYVNRAAEVITGCTREELVSMDFCDLVHPDSRDLITNGSRYEAKILTKDREERWLDITATAVDLDGIPGRLVSAFDFTEHGGARTTVGCNRPAHWVGQLSLAPAGPRHRSQKVRSHWPAVRPATAGSG